MTKDQLQKKRLRLIAKKKELDEKSRVASLEILKIQEVLQRNCKHPNKITTRFAENCPNCGWGMYWGIYLDRTCIKRLCIT